MIRNISRGSGDGVGFVGGGFKFRSHGFGFSVQGCVSGCRI